MRIAIAGIMHESNTFASTVTDRTRFEQGSLTWGDEVVRTWATRITRWAASSLGAESDGYELVPIVMALATPSGPVDDAVLDDVVECIVRGSGESNADGLLARTSRSDASNGTPTPTERCSRRLRFELGRGLADRRHARLSRQCFTGDGGTCRCAARISNIPACRSAELGLLAVGLMARTVRGDMPVTYRDRRSSCRYWARRRIANRCDRCSERHGPSGRDGILSVSLMAGFPYADVPEMGPSVIAVADGDRGLAAAAAEELGQRMWEFRREFLVKCPNAAEGVRLAITAAERPGDSGGPGR